MDKVGDILASAYFEDDTFREAIYPINMFLRRKSQEIMEKMRGVKDEAAYLPIFNLAASIESSFNNYAVSSFHAARACELFNLEARQKVGDSENPRALNCLMTFQHAFGLEALFNLSYAKGLTTNQRFAEIVNINNQKIIELFDELFPTLEDARNALAHQEERVLGVVGMSEKAKNEQGPIMFHALAGAIFRDLVRKIRSDNANGSTYEKFDFSFETKLYFQLAQRLSEILK